jgi:hypothetical protein
MMGSACGVIDLNHRKVVECNHRFVPLEVAQANAKLIAQAPVMLAALKDLVRLHRIKNLGGSYTEQEKKAAWAVAYSLVEGF